MRYVIIGNSTAGIGCVEGIRRFDKESEITIITNERYHTYSRPLISYLLLNKISREKIKYRADSFYEDNRCGLLYGEAVKINPKAKSVVLAGDQCLSYDKLLIATGSSAFIPPLDGLETVADKYTFMSLDDAIKLDMALNSSRQVLILGAGLIGLKCAEGILAKSANVTVLDLAPRILSSILDNDSAHIMQKHLEDCGIKFHLSTGVRQFEGNNAILTNGDSIAFDILILAVGVRPNTSLLNGIADIDRGIVINAKSETSVPDIYAAGDCTQTFDVSSGQNRIMALLPNAYMQGECAGINMAGGEKCFGKAIPMNAIGFFGLHVITAGSYTGDVYIKNERGNYKCLFYSDNCLNGYILVGNVEKAGIYTALIRERTPLDSIDFPLICEKPGLMAFSKEDRALAL